MSDRHKGRRSMIRAVASAAVILLATTTTAFGQVTPIEHEQGKAWEHAHSKIVFATEVAGMKRTRLSDFGKELMDISGTYNPQDNTAEATVYVYQAGLVDASVWHDRGLLVFQSGRLGTADMSAMHTGTFVPPGGKAATGIWSTVPMSGGSIRSTGIALFPLDNWLVKLRLSSTTMDQSQLDAQLLAFIAGLTLPAPKDEASPAYQVVACQSALPDRRAKRIKPDPAFGLMAGVLGQIADQGGGKTTKKIEPKPYCRDSLTTPEYGIYRAGGSTDSYAITFGDAGIAGFVGGDDLAGLLDGRGGRQFSLSLATTYKRYNFAGFDRLPPPAQAIEALDKDAPISSSSRNPGGKDNQTITISSGN